MDLLTNDFILGDLMVDRLIAEVAELGGRVQWASTLQAIVEGEYGPPKPNQTFIVFGGEVMGDDVVQTEGLSIASAYSGFIFQRWIVVPGFINVSDTQGNAGVHRDAGPIRSKIRDALSGWEPFSDGLYLQRVTPPPPFSRPGEGFYPLSFQIQFST